MFAGGRRGSGGPGWCDQRRAGIANREYATNEDKRQVLDPDKLADVRDAHVAVALRLEEAFGLRGEEAIKFTPARDDRGDRIRLKGSTTKGGRPREVRAVKDSKRKLLDEARLLAGGGAPIPRSATTGSISRCTRAGRGRRACTACTRLAVRRIRRRGATVPEFRPSRHRCPLGPGCHPRPPGARHLQVGQHRAHPVASVLCGCLHRTASAESAIARCCTVTAGRQESEIYRCQ